MSDVSTNIGIKLSLAGAQQVGSAARQVKTDVTAMGAAAEKSASQIRSAYSGLAGTVSAVLSGIGIMSTIDAADSWGQYAIRIRQATQSTEEYDHVQKRMLASANETYRSIEETRESFIRLSPIIRNMGYDLDTTIDVIDSFSGLLVTNAASADAGAAALNALSRSMQLGRVNAMSWATIVNTMPSLVDMLVESTGKSAEEIRKLGTSGKLSVEALTNALAANNEKIMQQVRDMPTTVRDAVQNLKNSFTEYVGGQNEALGVTAALAEAIDFLGRNFSIFAEAGIVAAIAGLTRYVGGLTVATAQTLMKAAASRKTALEELQLARAQEVQTAATLKQVTAMRGLGATHLQVDAAIKAHAASTVRLAAAKSAFTTVGRGLLGLLGGPIGIAATVGITALSFLGYKKNTEDAAAATKKMEDAAALMNVELDKLTKNQAASRIDLVKEAISKLESNVATASAKLETMDRNMRFKRGDDLKEARKEYRKLKSEIDTATAAIEEHQAQLLQLQGIVAGVSGAQSSAFSDTASGYLKELQKRIATLQDGGDAVKSAQRYIAETAGLTDIDKAGIISAANAIKTLESLKKNNGNENSVKTYIKNLQQQIRSTEELTTVETVLRDIQEGRVKFGTIGAQQAALALAEQVDAAKKLNDLQKESKKIIDDQRTPLENYANQVAKYAEMLDRGLLSADAYRQAVTQANQTFTEAERQKRDALFSGLLTEEEQIKQSYERRREEILLMTEVTESERQEALRRLNEQYQEENAGYWGKWLASAEKALTDFDRLAGDTIENFSSQFGSAFESVIFDSESLGDAFSSLAESMARSIVNSLGQMAAQWAAYQLIQSVMGKTAAASAMAAKVSEASAAQQMAGLNAYASTAAIPIVGPAMAPAAQAGAMIATAPAVASIASLMSSVVGARADGGPVIEGLPYWVGERKERELFVPNQSGHIYPESQLTGGGNVTINLIEDRSRAGRVTESQDANGDRFVEIIVADIRGDGPVAQTITDTWGIPRRGR